MKKIMVIFFLIVIVFLIGCAKVSDEKLERKLDELQITVCEEADRVGTCQTRLIEVGIVMPDECCESLGKCCENG